MKIDLHVHSTHSDGTWSVSNLLKYAEKNNISALCVTDHDNFSGSIEAQKIKKEIYSGILISGIELSTLIEGFTVHLLAYFNIKLENVSIDLKQLLTEIKYSRVNRMKKMINNAQKLGIDISYEDILAEASKDIDGKSTQPIDILSRPHLARVLIEKGYVQNFEKAFDIYLNEGGSLYSSRYTPTADEIIPLIKKNRGLVIWAHPMHGLKENMVSLTNVAMTLLHHGIDGVERYYNYEDKYPISKNFENKGNKFLDKFLLENNLLKTSGGDFHGNVGQLGMDIDQKDWDLFYSKLLSL